MTESLFCTKDEGLKTGSETLAKSDVKDTLGLAKDSATLRGIDWWVEQDAIIYTNRADWSINTKAKSESVAEPTKRYIR